MGLFFGGSPFVLSAIRLVWGFAIVADSAQFSAAISELCHSEYTGTALTIQTSLGCLLTVVSIWMIPQLVRLVGWQWSFAYLAAGPALGILAMRALRRSPQSVRMAGGKR